MEQQDVQTSQHETDELGTKEQIPIAIERRRIKQQRAREHHHDEAAHGPRHETADDFRHGHALHRKPEQAQIDDGGESREDQQGQNVDGQNDQKEVMRLAQREAARRR